MLQIRLKEFNFDTNLQVTIEFILKKMEEYIYWKLPIGVEAYVYQI